MQKERFRGFFQALSEIFPPGAIQRSDRGDASSGSGRELWGVSLLTCEKLFYLAFTFILKRRGERAEHLFKFVSDDRRPDAP